MKHTFDYDFATESLVHFRLYRGFRAYSVSFKKLPHGSFQRLHRAGVGRERRGAVPFRSLLRRDAK